VDGCNRALEQANVLEIKRRRTGNGGRNLPSIYSVIEPDGQGRTTGAPGPHDRSARTAPQEQRSQDATTPAPRTRPSNAGAGSLQVENYVEERSPQPPAHRDSGPPSDRRGTPEIEQAAELLCAALCETWAGALGFAPCEDFNRERRQWLQAATTLLRRHPRERLTEALAYATTDEILGSRALTMPGFAQVADQLIARAHIRDQRHSQAPRPAGRISSGDWPDARAALERAALRYGRLRGAAARAELSAADRRFDDFFQRVSWTELCERDMRYAELRYAEIWAALPTPTTPEDKEPAA
jgi:hypothetical protein